MLREYTNMTAHFENFDGEPMVSTEETREILEQVERKFPTPDQWIQCEGMHDANGHVILPELVSQHQNAVCWCLGEAIFQVCLGWRGKDGRNSSDYPALDVDICEIVSDAIIDLYGFEFAQKVDMHTYLDPDHDREDALRGNIINFNDHQDTKHRHIIEVLQHAQQAA